MGGGGVWREGASKNPCAHVREGDQKMEWEREYEEGMVQLRKPPPGCVPVQWLPGAPCLGLRGPPPVLTTGIGPPCPSPLQFLRSSGCTFFV